MTLSSETLQTILESEDLTTLAASALVETVRKQPGIEKSIPDGVFKIDPRTGDRIVYNTARARRPHDNVKPASQTPAALARCVIGEGKTTGVIDLANLSKGFTFINKNLFPMVFPLNGNSGSVAADRKGGAAKGTPAFGLHFLQWTSNEHDLDWHNMPLVDLEIVMRRLAALERKLLCGQLVNPEENKSWGDRPGYSGYAAVIKNYGRLVGGSLEHGHQQVAFGNIMPRFFADNLRFEKEHGEKFAGYMLRENPDNLLVHDLGEAVLVVPYFMRRPFDLMVIMKDSTKRYLHDLSESEISAAAQGWHEAIWLMLEMMPRVGREPAYNVIVHNGPGAGLYFEFLPYTQERGGYEHLGLFVCNGNPESSAQELRQLLKV